jgi:hypothetical protein
MPAQVIPLDSSPNQTWQTSVNINGTVVTFFCEANYNEIAEYWTISISDQNQNLLLSGQPMVAGLNLLRQYQYLGIGSLYLINVSGTDEDSPSANDLGSNWQLVWSDNTVVSQAA